MFPIPLILNLLNLPLIPNLQLSHLKFLVFRWQIRPCHVVDQKTAGYYNWENEQCKEKCKEDSFVNYLEWQHFAERLRLNIVASVEVVSAMSCGTGPQY